MVIQVTKFEPSSMSDIPFIIFDYADDEGWRNKKDKGKSISDVDEEVDDDTSTGPTRNRLGIPDAA